MSGAEAALRKIIQASSCPDHALTGITGSRPTYVPNPFQLRELKS
jgi:hypothetical protein